MKAYEQRKAYFENMLTKGVMGARRCSVCEDILVSGVYCDPCQTLRLGDAEPKRAAEFMGTPEYKQPESFHEYFAKFRPDPTSVKVSLAEINKKNAQLWDSNSNHLPRVLDRILERLAKIEQKLFPETPETPPVHKIVGSVMEDFESLNERLNELKVEAAVEEGLKKLSFEELHERSNVDNDY